MQTLTPTSIKIIDYYDDGLNARHYRFQLLDKHSISAPTPGQFFMLHVPGVGAAPFTFTAPPDGDGVFRALVRRMGSVTQGLFSCQNGAIVGMRGPYGKGWPLQQFAGKRLLLIAGGCGLAPLSNLIDQLSASDTRPQMALIYGAATTAAQVLNPERQRWREQMPVYDVVEDKPINGLMGNALDVLDHVLGEQGFPDMLALCGPETMMRLIASDFVERGLDASAIMLSVERRMHCAVGSCGHCYIEHEYACKQGPTYSWDQYQALVYTSPSDQQLSYHC